MLKVRIVTEFVKSYKQNFVQSLGLTVILAILWYSSVTYFMMSFGSLEGGFSISAVVMIIVAFEVMMLTVYMCALLAKYDLKTITIVKNSFLFTHAYFMESVKAFGLIVGMLFCLIFVPGLVIVLPGSIAYSSVTYFMMSFGSLEGGFSISAVVMIIVAFEVMMLTVYMCALLAKYDLKTITIVKNSFLFTHAYFMESVKAFGLIVGMLFCLIFVPGLVIVLPGSIALTASIFVRNSIHKYLERQKAIEELRAEQALEA